MFYSHYSKVPKKVWRWKNFTPKELASNGDGSLLINFKALDKLQKVRDLINKPLKINSAYRDPLYNAKIGGAPLSQHKYGTAFDISLKGHNKWQLLKICKEVGFKGFGFYNTFLHVDDRKKKAQWGKW